MRWEHIPSRNLMVPSMATLSASSYRRGWWSFEPPSLATTPPAKYAVVYDDRCPNSYHSDTSGIQLFQDDLLFTFSFNLIVSRDGENVKFPLYKTCSATLTWAPREVTCEANYMEVRVASWIRAVVGFVICKRDNISFFKRCL